MRLRTIGLIGTLVLGLLAAPLPAEAQQTDKVYRIGFLSDAPRMRPNFEVFRQGLRELGYIEGQNIVIEWRFASRNPDRLVEMAAELVRQKVDIIVAGGPLPPAAALKATRTIPIVACEVVQCGMRPVVIVIVHPDTNLALRIFEVTEGVQINAFVLERAPEALDENVVHPLALAVHGDTDSLLFEHIGPGTAGELAALIGVEDFRTAVLLDGLVQGLDAECRVLRVG